MPAPGIRTEINAQMISAERQTPMVFSMGIIVAYVAVNLFTILHHEPWLDEAQAWLIARDASLLGLLKQMNYEGSPALWHLILLPFAKAGLPYIWESLVHLVIATAMIAVFVLGAPFSRTTKVLFVFSYYMAYEFSVLARCYSLGVLLMFLIAAMHEQRFRHPVGYGLLVLLLSNANVFTLFVASALALRFGYEIVRGRDSVDNRKLACLGLAVMGLGMALAVLQLIPAPDNEHGATVNLVRLRNFPRAIGAAFFPNGGDQNTYALVAATILAAALLSILRRPGALFVVLWSFAALSYVFVFKYHASRRHHALLFMILMFGLWIARYEPDVYWFGLKTRLQRLYARIDFSGLARRGIDFCLFVGVAFCLKMHYEDIRYPFSASRETATFLLDHGLEGRPIVAHDSCSASAVLAHLPRRQFWYAGIRKYGSYTVWNVERAENAWLSVSEVVARGRQAFPDSDDLLFLLSMSVESPELHGLKRVFEPDTSRWITRDWSVLYAWTGVKTQGLAQTGVP